MHNMTQEMFLKGGLLFMRHRKVTFLKVKYTILLKM